MKRLEVYWLGLLTKEIEIFISGDLKHIEIVEAWKLLGLTLRETSREVYVPRIDYNDNEGLRVIADTYLELEKMLDILKEEWGNDKD